MKLSIINSIRTNNFNDKHVMQKITNLWKGASERLVENDHIMYGVYHEYESDYQGDYSLSVAIESNFGKNVLDIPKHETFKIFAVDHTEEQGVVKTWTKIWNQEEAGTLERAYSVDFEKYYPSGEVEIHIAIK